jgi:hypothetical protein
MVENKIINPRKSQKTQFPPLSSSFLVRGMGGWPLNVTPESSATYFANCHAPVSMAKP